MTQWIVDSRGLKVEPLLEERPVALVPEDHRFADRATLSLDEVAGEPFIAPCPVCAPHVNEEQAAVFRARGLTRLIAHASIRPATWPVAG